MYRCLMLYIVTNVASIIIQLVFDRPDAHSSACGTGLLVLASTYRFNEVESWIQSCFAALNTYVRCTNDIVLTIFDRHTVTEGDRDSTSQSDVEYIIKHSIHHVNSTPTD